MVDHARAARMAKRIQTIVATAIEREIKDPRLEFVTITDTRLTGDLHDATVFYTVRGRTVDAEPDLASAEDALTKARGRLRKIVGDQLSVRFTPTLTFSLDTVPEASAHFEEILAQARAKDEQLRAQASGATPAGDADPYRKPGDEHTEHTEHAEHTEHTAEER
ncbi:ribosome-binding factor A [Corynebacterium falsenii DSM 44353]|uniref:30S ribosome-binding factor RbfA n=2 Tax=Corynebacterium falsenii TaxID=108486 RepID=UPI0003E96076|nr:30S ribosome-binding factor RbfA [Corynebacterium falsenii]AHI03287.1 ribosome-binding factor A [Corynebacterium falsenii DSM 44353]MDC7103387.1 30S ribosome-binding factor RbfA [Corynebacterium falsenii]UBI03978.1 30S ribosome-binding factor RbfA [Corynebacterium falsenii]UBI06009.1 30S ribosome-binding factor RbfA [Corynebacterium falsenii]